MSILDLLAGNVPGGIQGINPAAQTPDLQGILGGAPPQQVDLSPLIAANIAAQKPSFKERVSGLLGFQDPNQGLLNFGANLLAQETPFFGQALGRAVLGTQQVARQNRLDELQKRRVEAEEQLRKIQQQAAQSKLPAIRNDRRGVPRFASGPNAGQEVFPGTPDEETGPLVTLRLRDGSTISRRRDDPEINTFLAEGATVAPVRQETGGVGEFNLKGKAADEIQANILSSQRSLSILGNIEKELDEDISRAGVTGSIKAFGQSTIAALDDMTRSIGLSFLSDVSQGLADTSIGPAFDPSLPANEVRENALAYSLARARKPTGRLNLQDVESARKDVNIRGLTSSKDVLAKLRAVREEIERSVADQSARLGKVKPITATNSTTGERIISFDGGQTWQPIQ